MIAFTYLIRHRTTGKVYYGVRHTKSSHPDQLWTTYFTTSKVVNKIIATEGPESFEFEVRRTFSTSASAIAWEHKVLRRCKAATSDQWLNRHNGGSKFCFAGQSHSEYVRRRISLVHKGKPKSDEWKAKVRAKALIREQERRDEGWTMPRDNVERRAAAKRGVRRTPEAIAAISRGKSGTRRVYQSDGSYRLVKIQQDQ